MTLVVDASVVVKWFVEEEFHDQAAGLIESRHDLHAPDLLAIEVVNVAWKKALRHEIDDVDAYEIARAVTGSIVTFHPAIRLVHDIAKTVTGGIPTFDPATRLSERALQIALSLRHPIYDCLYLALAEALGSVVVTADQSLVRKLGVTPFAALAVFLPDWVADEEA